MPNDPFNRQNPVQASTKPNNNNNPQTPIIIPGIPGPSQEQHSTVSKTVVIPPHNTNTTTTVVDSRKNEIKIEVSSAESSASNNKISNILEDSGKFLRPNR